MLQSLNIRNVALIERLTIPFERGLHTLTGETGAGKSIIVDAVNLVLGGRGDRGLIRTGTDRAAVEAEFSTDRPEALRWLAEQEIDAPDGQITLYREITASGRSTCRVCGVPVPLTALRELAALLMDVHGQHENQFLLDERYHLQVLDGTGDEAHQRLLRETEEACEAFLGCHRRWSHLVRENEQKQARMAELERSLEELRQAKLRPGEEEKLREERERNRHAGKIDAALREAREELTGEPDAALGRIRAAAECLDAIAPLGENYRALAGRIRSAFFELEEAGYELARLMDSGAFDPNRAEAVESRLELIARLERRYGADIPAVLAEQQRMEEELDRLTSMDSELASLAAQDRQLLQHYRSLARELTASRERLAARFEQGMVEQLRDLGMERTEFRAAFAPKPEKPHLPRPTGDDEVSFLISPNPGEPLKPLAKIASGGELSRLMLALKNLEARRGGVDCMVFDEIDTGISGRIAQAVAEKMANIARDRQVLCVTHLPQLAAMADVQLLVEKTTAEGRTQTHVRTLDMAERAEEVARMLGGAEGSGDSALQHARHLIEAAEELKAAQRGKA